MKQVLGFLCFIVSNYCPAQGNLTYSPAEYAIDYPQKWTLDTSRQKGPAIFVFSPLEGALDKFSENVNILTQNIAGQHISLNAYKSITEKQISTMAVNGKLIKSTVEKMSKGERYYVEYEMKMNENDLHIKSFCYIKKDLAYLVTFTAQKSTFDQYNKTGTEMLESFRLK